MASTEGLVPITRKFLASYDDKYPFAPLPDDVSRLSSEIRSIITDLLLISGFLLILPHRRYESDQVRRHAGH
uniref:Uncharacterized protein n=1 Tax=Populus trichocarpa TaxID=3694 RepID=U5GA28_POPTR